MDQVDTIETLKLLSPDLSKIGYVLNTHSKNKYPEIFDLVPFKSGSAIQIFSNEKWYVARLIDVSGQNYSNVTQLKPQEAATILRKLESFKYSTLPLCQASCQVS